MKTAQILTMKWVENERTSYQYPYFPWVMQMNHANQCLPLEYKLHNETDSVLLVSAVIKHLLFSGRISVVYSHWFDVFQTFCREDVRDILRKKNVNIDNCILMVLPIRLFGLKSFPLRKPSSQLWLLNVQEFRVFWFIKDWKYVIQWH